MKTLGQILDDFENEPQDLQLLETQEKNLCADCGLLLEADGGFGLCYTCTQWFLWG